MSPRIVAVIASFGLLAGACATETTRAGDISVLSQAGTTTTTLSPTTTAGESTTAGGPTTEPGASTSSTSSTVQLGGVPTLSWAACGAVQCATLAAPLDYSNPSKGTIDLALKRRLANSKSLRLGTLLVNPGGPGVGGTVLVDFATQIYSATLLDHFDIVAWDPRGTGNSDPIACVDSNDPYISLDPTPNTPAATDALQKAGTDLAAKCGTRDGTVLPYISTEATARDMDRIRRALGEAKISYFGFSYGSQLGGTWATLFPTTVRAAVLDGAIDPNNTQVQEIIAQTTGFELAFQHFLADCASRTTCAFYNGGDPTKAYENLVKKLDTNPLPSPRGRPAVNEAVIFYAVVYALYAQELWGPLAQALASAQLGDGSGLLELYDVYRTDYGDHTLEALLAITCLDEGPLSAADMATIDTAIASSAPHFQGTDAFTIACQHWPVPPVKKVPTTGKGAPPIVVVGTTGDPATPLESSRGMARALEHGLLIINAAEGHTGYKAGSCVGQLVDNYLVTLQTPADNTTCAN